MQNSARQEILLSSSIGITTGPFLETEQMHTARSSCIAIFIASVLSYDWNLIRTYYPYLVGSWDC